MCPCDRLPRVGTIAFWSFCIDRAVHSSSKMALESRLTRKRRGLERKSFELYLLRQTVERNLIRDTRTLGVDRAYSVFMANEWNKLDVRDEVSGHMRNWGERIFNNWTHYFTSIVRIGRNVYHLKAKGLISLYRRAKIKLTTAPPKLLPKSTIWLWSTSCRVNK